MSTLVEQPVVPSPTLQRTVLSAQNINKSFLSGESSIHILKGTDFFLEDGEFVAIEGRSGSGKSTFLHILGALESVDAGTTEFAGIQYAAASYKDPSWWNPPEWSLKQWMKTEIILFVINLGFAVLTHFWSFAGHAVMLTIKGGELVIGIGSFVSFIVAAMLYEKRERPRARLRNENFGFVFQFYHLLPELNAVQNTILAASIKFSVFGYFKKREELKTRAITLLTEFGLAHRLYHRPNQLSGGERQRVAIARALMNKPKVLFADEPTGNLDADTGRQIMDVLEALHREHGQTIVMVTHDRTLAREADRVLVLRDGKLETAV